MQLCARPNSQPGSSYGLLCIVYDSQSPTPEWFKTSTLFSGLVVYMTKTMGPISILVMYSLVHQKSFIVNAAYFATFLRPIFKLVKASDNLLSTLFCLKSLQLKQPQISGLSIPLVPAAAHTGWIE